MSLNFPTGFEGLVHRADNDIRYVYEDGAWRVIDGAFTHNPGPNAPSDPELGDIWVDTTKCPPELMIYDDDCTGNGPEWKPGQYLSKVNDDTAAGEITFEGMTRHIGGVKLSGGSSADVGNGFTFSSGFLRGIIGGKSITFTTGNSFAVSVDGSGGLNQNLIVSKDNTIVNIASDQNESAVQVKGTYNNSGTSWHSSYWSQGIDYTSIANDAKVYGLKLESPKNTAATTAATNYGIYIAIEHTDEFFENYGVVSTLSKGTGTNYNFFALGDAPNYFAGNIECDGLINGAFSLRMESDDPAAYQTTYTTDGEGNQVENQEYIGTTEDLLSIIKDLRDRVAALEAA